MVEDFTVVDATKYVTVHKRLLAVGFVVMFVTGVVVGSKATSAYLSYFRRKETQRRREENRDAPKVVYIRD